MKIIVRLIVFIVVCILLGFVAITWPNFPISNSPTPSDSVSAEALSAHVRYLSETCLPRDHENTQNLDKAAHYIQDSLNKSTEHVALQTFTAKGKNYNNVVAIYGPESEEIYVVGAHYDAYAELPGADDNASGVAGLIELGNLLGKTALKSRIILVAYTLEEPPYFRTEQMGSAVHAQSLAVNKTNVKLMISLEMIGYFTDEKNSQEFPIPIMRWLYPSEGNYIAVIDQLFANDASAIKKAINTHTNVPAYSINAPRSIPGVDFSDHMNYWNRDFPAVMVTDTAFYRNKNYHTPEDTFEKLDYEKMAQVVYGVFKYLEANNT